MRSIFLILFVLLAASARSQTLEDYFRYAEENNPGLQARYRDFEAAVQKIPQASGLADPSLSVSAFGQMIETRVGPQKARFTLSQMFPWFGTLKAQGNVAALAAEARLQSYIDARNKLFYELAAAYYPLYELSEFIEIEQKNIRLLESYKAIATAKFKNASTSMVDVLRVDIMLKSAETEIAILSDEKKPLTVAFNRMLNRSDTTAVIIPDTLIAANPVPSGQTAPAVSDHPLITELDLRRQSSQAAEVAARKQGLPRLGIGLDYIIVGERTDLAPGAPPPPDNGQDAIMPMVTTSLPIFRKKYRAAVKEAQLMQESYDLQKQQMVNSLTATLEMTDFELVRQQALITLYEKQVAETEQVLRLLFTAYSNSGGEFEEVLMVQQKLLDYEKKKVAALVSYQLAMAKYNYLIAKEY